MIITRELINKNIKYHSVIPLGLKNFNYAYLSLHIDAYKNLLLSKGAKSGNTILIGTPASIDQMAMVFACAELGMTITIVEFLSVESNSEYKKILPIDFFVSSMVTPSDKFNTYRDNCSKTIILDDEYKNLDFAPKNTTILASEDSIFLKCINSKGEIINHTHGFLELLIKRNSSMFYGSAAMFQNLNHGSSCATYFLPVLISSKTTDMYNSTYEIDMPKFFSKLSSMNISLNNIYIPYTKAIDTLFDSEQSMPECIIYTLGIIRKKWSTNLKDKVKDVISIFGTTETSGPILINQASDPNFREDSYKEIDDFYKLTLSEDHKLEIMIPVYNRKFHSDDKFNIQDGKYIFDTSLRMMRVDDFVVNIYKYKVYNEYINRFVRSDLVIDTFKNSTYLAVWENSMNEQHLDSINNFLKSKSEDKLYIEKYAVLNYNDFHNEDTLDGSSVIEYFRNIGE